MGLNDTYHLEVIVKDWPPPAGIKYITWECPNKVKLTNGVIYLMTPEQLQDNKKYAPCYSAAEITYIYDTKPICRHCMWEKVPVDYGIRK